MLWRTNYQCRDPLKSYCKLKQNSAGARNALTNSAIRSGHWPCRSCLFSRPYTNGRAYVMSQCCVRLSVLVRLCIVAKRCVLFSKYLLSYYWHHIGSRIWEVDWYQNEWPWPLFRGRIKVMSTIALHSTLNISLRDEGLVPKDHQ